MVYQVTINTPHTAIRIQTNAISKYEALEIALKSLIKKDIDIINVVVYDINKELQNSLDKHAIAKDKIAKQCADELGSNDPHITRTIDWLYYSNYLDTNQKIMEDDFNDI